MGRIEPSYAPIAQQSFRKDQRAKQARATISKTIPQIIASDARARKGIENARPFPDSADGNRNAGSSAKKQRGRKHSKVEDRPNSIARAGDDEEASENATTQSDYIDQVVVRIRVSDTLTVARELNRNAKTKKNVAILNMASPLRPGGGVLNGATSQEESLCARTTLLPSLKEEWYRLPEVGGIWSPEVLVFRVPGANGDEELGRGQRFYVDVVSAAMTRFPDVIEHPIGDDTEVSNDESNDEERSPVEKRYASQKDRDLALEKMRAVMATLAIRKAQSVVLGAWGCGAYGNPVSEIATAWKRAIFGTRSKPSKANLGSLKEIVFAIKDLRMAQQFAHSWGENIEVEQDEKSARNTNDKDLHDEHIQELEDKISSLELQIAEVKTPMLKQGLQGTLHTLRQELAKAGQDESVDSEDD